VYGINGAAMATIISSSISVFWSDLFLKDMKRLFVMKMKALLFFEPIKFILRFGAKK
jgi:Na+-driven multidrug efflux pump